MNFNGTIIITDPCYIAENKDWGNGFNYNNMTISEEVGFSDNYIWEDTGVGDGRWKVSKLKNILGLLELEKFIDDIEEAYYNLYDNPSIENQINLEKLALEVERRLENIKEPITVAVMGCVVNGPGEAKEEDIGIAGGIGEGLLIKKGEIIKKVKEEELLDTLRQELLNWNK